MCCWSLQLIFKAKLKLQSANKKVQYGCQVAILKVTSLKSNGLQPIATKNMYMKFETEISKQTLIMLWKYQLQDFAHSIGMRIVTSSPHYPRGHGLVERRVQTVKHIMAKCKNGRTSWTMALLYLKGYSAIPHAGISRWTVEQPEIPNWPASENTTAGETQGYHPGA